LWTVVSPTLTSAQKGRGVLRGDHLESRVLRTASLWKVDHTLGTDLENDPLPKMPYHENETVQPLRAYLDAAVVQVSKAVRNSRH
jgi:hypothetical protein